MQAASKSSANASGARNAVKHQVNNAKSHADPASAFGSFARHTMDTMHEVVDEGKAVAKDQFDATAKWVGNTTKANPMRALGVVAAASFVIGLFMARR